VTFTHADPPALRIIIALEQRVRLDTTCRNEGERDRLRHWLAAHPELLDLFNSAQQLAAEQTA